jgi:hypothetical protein
MIGLCLASGTLAAFIAASSFTLAWTHSIEKQRWEEDWRIHAHADGRLQLQLVEGRIRGSGAGMEPPDGARLENGVWHYPVGLALEELALAHSSHAEGYELCITGACRPLTDWLPGLPEKPDVAMVLTVSACHR